MGTEGKENLFNKNGIKTVMRMPMMLKWNLIAPKNEFSNKKGIIRSSWLERFF